MGALAELNTLFDGLFLGATSVLVCSVGFFFLYASFVIITDPPALVFRL